MTFVGGGQGGSKAGESLGSDKKRNGGARTPLTWLVRHSEHPERRDSEDEVTR